MYMHMYIYIYRERERDMIHIAQHNIYIYIYREREREHIEREGGREGERESSGKRDVHTPSPHILEFGFQRV